VSALIAVPPLRQMDTVARSGPVVRDTGAVEREGMARS
jgi:hypothetical protein